MSKRPLSVFLSDASERDGYSQIAREIGAGVAGGGERAGMASSVEGFGSGGWISLYLSAADVENKETCSYSMRD